MFRYLFEFKLDLVKYVVFENIYIDKFLKNIKFAKSRLEYRLIDLKFIEKIVL